MKKICWCFLFAMFLLLSACSTVTVDHRSAESADFSVLKNYSWLSSDAAAEIQARNPKIEKMVMTAVNQQLRGKGYNRTTEGNADFYVSWFGKVNEKVAEKSISHFYRTSGYGVLAGQQPAMVEKGAETKPYVEGTLILDIIEARSKKVIWRGSAADTIKEGMSDAEIVAYIQRSVNKILAAFPGR